MSGNVNMEPRLFCGFILLSFCNSAVDGASILALFSSLSFADHAVFRGYVSLLTQRGHTVVLMTPYPGQFQFPEVEKIIELDVGQESSPFWDEYKMLMSNTDDYYPRLRALNELSLKLAIAQLRSKQMTALFINPNVKFDLVITEADVPVLYGAAEKYKAPHIAITTSSGKLHQHEAKGNPTHPLLHPDVNTLNYRSNLTYWQKINEIYRYYQTKDDFYNHHLPLCDLAAKKVFGVKKSLQEIEYDIDLLFIANNPLLIGNRPVVPATIFVDMMHIKPALGLPQNLQALLDSATKGVVYFSLGAVQEAEQLSPAILETLTDAFKDLPYTVLWNIGNITAINKPENVHALPWFPQQPVLAHPNVKAFITHGGPRSLEEAVFYQVPIIGLPLVKSRKVYMEQVTKHGAGVILDTYYLDKETVKKVIIDVVGNQQYKNSISKLREMIVDPIISGPEHAIWWTEYLLRHRGARHLRSPIVGVSFTQYYTLDLLALFLLLVLFACYFLYQLIRIVSRRLRARVFRTKSLELPAGKFKAL